MAGQDRALRMHILRMGLTPGVTVSLIKTAPMGDPLEISLRGYELSLRKAIASDIEVQVIEPQPPCDHTITSLNSTTTIEHSKIGEDSSYIDKKPVKSPNTTINLVLIGNQNSGKTTLFNRLTGSHQRVGNFPGVTVEKVDGSVINHNNITITDLPGIYSLSPYSREEIITRNFLLYNRPDGIINIIDATNIERNLFLTLQLLELNIPMVIALNMMDVVTKRGDSIDINGLESALGVPIIPISAIKNAGLSELVEHAVNVARYQEIPGKIDFCNPHDRTGGAIHRCIHSINHLIEEHAQSSQIATRFATSQLIEDDPIIVEDLKLDTNDINSCDQIIKQMEEDAKMDRQAAICDMRFRFIENLAKNHVSKVNGRSGSCITKNIDRILTGKYTALPAFVAIISVIFYITFGPMGSWLSAHMEQLLTTIAAIISRGLTHYGINPVLHSLIIDGICRGVGSVLTFLPTIIALFFFLSILESTGYMTRVAFVMDKLLRKIGLSGRSFVPMLIGFGCSVPAIMATRTIPSERDRKLTILLISFMSCSAKLPIYALFTNAFFTDNRTQVIISLYIIGIVVGIAFAYLIKVLVFKGETVPFVMEMPSYRIPSWQNVYKLIYYKAKGFITKAFTLIFWATIVIWWLQNFDKQFNMVEDPSRSLLSIVAAWITPIFRPLGISDWRVATAFVTGFMAKESVVSTLTVLVGDVNKLPLLFNKLTAFVFMVFSLLYTPCVATIATVKRELGNFYALLVVMFQCSLAWLIAYTVYQIGHWL